MNKIKLLLSVFFLLNLSSIYSQCALYTFKSGSGSICANDQVTLTALAAQPSYGNGNQGALTVSGTTSVDATRSAVFGAIGVVGSNSIQVASASGFAIGNEVLIISMQDSTKSNSNVTGQYEFRIISAISSNTLTFTQPLVNTYLVNAATKHQVILVPNYSNVTVNNGGLLTCSNWNGTTGGVLCFRANGNLTVNSGGIISASAKGYRGLSHAALWRNKDGAQGEGIYGQGFIGGNSNGSNGYWNLPNGNGGGGGTGTGDAAGGGGGSYGSLGTDGVDWGGHFKGRKGDTISNPGVTRLYFGGAGGEGGGDEDGAYPGKGGNGGGIIYIAAVSITNNGIINSNGETGGNGCNNCGGSGSGMGGGAGGAGGTIELGLNTFSGAGNSIAVSGGTLGTGYGAGNGGAGGNGRIRFDMTSAPPVTTPIAFQGIPNPIAGVTFSWSTGATTSSIVVSPTVTSGYTVVVTSTAACSGLSSSQNLTVNPQTATLTVNTPTVCAGFPATLIASGGGLLPNSIPNLVAYYKFDEGTGGNTADLSGNNLTGTLVNTPVWGASTASILPSAGNALTYNNSNSYVNIADAPILSSLQNSLTIEAWVYPTDNSNNTIIDRANYNFLFATHSNGQPGLGFYNPNTNWQYSTASVPINAWSHVAVTWEHNGTNGILKFYINGVFSNQISINNTLSFNAGNINIGRQEPNSCQCNIFGGKIDEVKVWNISRSQAQIAAGRNFSLHSYSWSGGISNGVPFTPTTSASYTVSNQFGCATPVSVLVSAPPLAISNPSAICPGGGPVVLTASGASSYTWSTGSNNATISVTPSITTTYTVIGTAPNGCFIPEFRTVVVNVVPTISIINPGTIPNCSSATLTASAPMVGTGGVITYSNGYVIHTFTSSGTFNMPSTGTVEALIVAGGGGGGNDIGGGGGGGGVMYSSNLVVNTGTYNVVIGAGGNGAAAGTGGLGTNGGNSVFNGLTAIGGGRGASKHDANNFPASVGGSGGGASGGGGTGGGTNANYGGANAAGTPGQGNAGGTGAGTWYPGGGGGAGGVGLSAPATGGPGIRYLSLSPYYFGGGGGGAGHSGNSGNGGIGGGGAGGSWNGYVSTGGAGINNGLGGGVGAYMPGGNAGANTGGGGGGGTHYNSNNNGGNGGSGIVIIKYLIPANPVYSYTWSNGANSSSIVVSPTVNTTYSVSLTNTTGCSANSTPITLSVTPLNILVTASPSLICNGQSATLTASAPILGTGGSMTILNGYAIHTFTNVGASTFTPPSAVSVEYLIVAGGGGSGASNGTGGGGGGGVLTGTTNLVGGQVYTINVGAGGLGAVNQSTRGANGSNSSAFSLVALGGGGSGSENGPILGGASGGSGGGGVRSGVGGAGTVGQGFAGGSNVNDGGPHYSGGGGGGAGAAGTNGSAGTLGVGGNGIQSAISGTATYYGGGGGAGSYSGMASAGAGGLGGGAMGGTNPSDGRNRNGSPNTGGGGAGTGNIGNPGGNGGSGIVIVKYLIPASQNYTYTWSNGGANSSSIVVTPNTNTNYSVVLSNTSGCSSPLISPITLSVTQLQAPITGMSTVCAGITVTLNTAISSTPATGGVITYSNGYTIHTFTSNGTFNAPSNQNIEYLVVAGGGGSGGFGGGGGAGGAILGSANVSGTFAVVVGAGGNGESSPDGGGSNGANSSFNSVVAIGGGTGRHSALGTNGGSGGGNGYGTASPTSSFVAGQGSSGGFGNSTGPGYPGGGGGGATSVGGNASANSGGTAGNAGAGLLSSISGAPVYYAVGGPGSARSGGVNGTPATGGSSVGQDGAPNRGNGGGGGLVQWVGKNGGSGVVIIRYQPISVASYTWSNGANTQSITINPTVTTSYSVAFTTTTGCIGTSTLATVNVNPLPVVSISGSSAICVGQTATLVANGANTYTWSNASTASSITLSPASNTSYSLTGTAAGCIGSATRNLTVNANPIITVNSGAICAGQNFTINPNGANTYTIQGGNAVVSPAGNTSYTVAGTSTAGCVSQAFATSNLTVNPNPIITVNNGAICVGQNFTINPNGANTYTIQGGNSVVSPAGNTSYTVAGTSTAGCLSQAFATSNLTVNPNPTITVNNGTICVGQNFTINPNGANTYTIQGGNAVVSPPSNSSYTVIGTNSVTGCRSQAFATSSLLVNANPIITVNSGAICAGQNFTINPNGANTYTIQGGNAVVSPPSNAVFTVAGTSTAGCVSQAFATSSLIVNQNPTITVNNGAICAGQNFTINPNGANTYTIQGGSAVVSPAGNTSFTVAGTSTAGCVSQAFATSNLTVNPNPTVSISGASGICTGQNASLTANGATTYTWSTGSTSASIITTPSANTTYTLTGSTPQGCSSFTTQLVTVQLSLSVSIAGPTTVCYGEPANISGLGGVTYTWNTGATSSTIAPTLTTTTTFSIIGASGTCSNTASTTISVTPNPTITITGTNAICAGSSTSLTVNGATTYTWSSGSTSASVVFSPSATSVYSVVGSYSTGCLNATTQTVTVYTLPVVSISGPSVVCLGDSISLVANGANTYVWNNNATTTTTIVITPTTTSTYSAVGTDTNGCVGLSAIDSIFVNPVPILSIISTATAICVGDTVKFTAAGATSYAWNIGDNDSLIVVTPTITTTYSVVGTNGFGCSSTKTDSVKVNALPNITISGTTGTICIGENITLTANGANTYTWSGGINTNSIAVSPSVSTTYSASGTSTDGCVGSNTLQLNVTECTNIKTIASKAAIKVYPNPNHGEFIIELVSANNSNITITNVLGQIIKTQKAELMNQIDLNAFDKGIYFINVMENNQSVYRGSIIKQ